MVIRPEEPPDAGAVHALNEAAFGRAAEANLVDTLRHRAVPLVSLVAQEGKALVGHILFSPVTLTGGPGLKIAGLVPAAVAPGRQRTGIGSALVRAGLDACRRAGYVAIVVLGHAAYYPRFGFVPASRFGIRSEYDVPDDVFMIVELEAGALAGKSGTIGYDTAFSQV